MGSPAPSLAPSAVTPSQRHPNPPPNPVRSPQPGSALPRAGFTPPGTLRDPAPGCDREKETPPNPPPHPQPGFAGSFGAGDAGAVSPHLFWSSGVCKDGEKKSQAAAAARRSSDIWEPLRAGPRGQANPPPQKLSARARHGASAAAVAQGSPRFHRRSELVCFISPLSGSVSVSPPSLALSFSLAFL